MFGIAQGKSMSEDVRKLELKPSLSVASVPATPPPTPTTPFQKPCLQRQATLLFKCSLTQQFFNATFMQNWKKLCGSTKLSNSERLSDEETPSSSNDETVAEDGLAKNDELKSTQQ
uniref:ICA69 domain-containing protein n=1 Tax=Ascaris lumbricoides TaxID=6252 RepID=A0A0M3I8H9_ASCLU